MDMRNVAAAVVALGLSACAGESIDVTQPAPPPDRRPPLAEPRAGSASSAWSNSAEYRRSGGLSDIRAAEAYARRPGGRPGGEGVLIGIIDGGVDTKHPDLSVNLAANFGADSPGPEFHGTHVAGIAAARRDGEGMHGVAYASRINAIDVFRSTPNPGIFPATAADEIAAAIGSTGGFKKTYGLPPGVLIGGIESNASLRSDVTNLSLGIPGAQPAVILEAMRDATARGTLIVAALGNDSLSGASGGPAAFVDAAGLSGRAVAVGNWDGENHNLEDIIAGRVPGSVLARSSNRCGSLRNCLFAPGTRIVSTVPGGGYDVATGTSMAAPHVTGALAVLKAAFPGMAPEALLRRLFDTAFNPLTGGRGDYDETGIFGWGLMDLAEAMRPRGPLALVTAEGKVPLQSTALSLGSGFSADALTRAFDSIIAYDAEGFAYRASLADHVAGPKDSGRRFLDRLLSRNRNRDVAQSVGPLAMTASFSTEDRPSGLGSGDAANSDTFMLRLQLTEDTSFSVGRGRARASLMEEEFGAAEYGLFADVDLASPFLGFAGRSDALEMRSRIHEGTTLSVYAHMPAEIAVARGDLTDTRGAGAALRHALSDDLSVTAQFGTMQEREGFWGSTGGGGLAIEGGVTNYIGLAASYDLSPRLSISGAYGYGTVDPEIGGGLLKARGNFTGESYALGATLRDTLSRGDRLSFTAALPFRASSAPVTLTAVSGFTPGGVAVLERRDVDLSPKGREKQLSMSYGMSFPREGFTAEFATMLRLQPDHRHDADPEAIIGGGFEWRF